MIVSPWLTSIRLLAAALILSTPSQAADVGSLLKELEKELSALDEPAPKTAAKANIPTQTFRALAIPPVQQGTAQAGLDAKLKSLSRRIASQRQHVTSHFSGAAPTDRSHIATIATQLVSGDAPAITNLKIYLDEVLVFAAEPIAALTAGKATLYQNAITPRQYQLKITGSRLVSAGDEMRLEDFTVTAPWQISSAQKKHLALLKPMITAGGKATLEVLFD